VKSLTNHYILLVKIVKILCVTLNSIPQGPGLWAWYKTLHKLVGHSKRFMAVKKVALDQIVAAPPFYAGFLITTGAMQQQNWKQIEQRIENDYMDILINNWKVSTNMLF
jgi:Mpv17 / PMP22 family